jgi:preprotein translocase subunit SecG
METGLLILQIIVSVVLIALIMLQAQGSGLGATWGGGGETYHTRRGVEKVIFYATIVCTVVFTVTSIALLIIRQ